MQKVGIERYVPVLSDRNRKLLMLLKALGGRAANLDFQKLLFLYCQEQDAKAAYEFVPYRSGAFSFTSYADRRKLIERGLLVDDEHHWELTENGCKIVRQAVEPPLAAFAQRHRGLRGDALVAETYRRFPYYAIRSEIAKRVLQRDDSALRAIERAHPRMPKGAALFTIGYEGRTLECYLNVLLLSGVTLLCDVRRNAISRKYGFSKGTLSKACKGVGLRYEHIPDLGIDSADRQGLETQTDYDALFVRYVRRDLPNQGEMLARIIAWIRSGERVGLTCYERLPEQCHRHCVAEAIERDLGGALAATHL